MLAVARGMAAYADHATGRDCRPTNARLVEVLRVSLSTVQRARRVLKALGLVVELVRGRSIMTRAERLTAWRRGSAHRRIAAEFALCSRRQRRPLPADLSPTDRGTSRSAAFRPRRHLRSVERDTPPGALTERWFPYESNTHLQATTETRKAAPQPAPTNGKSNRPRYLVAPATRRLAEAARGRLPWLSGVSARRLAPSLHRFASAGWTPRDLERGVLDALATRGWRLPREITQPAAYLATLLRGLDPADRPGALDAQIAATEAAQRRYERQLLVGTPCPHGQPAGDVPSPLRGLKACPVCRADNVWG